MKYSPKHFDVFTDIDSSNIREVYERLHLDMHGVVSKYDTGSTPIQSLCVEAVEHLEMHEGNDLLTLRGQAVFAAQERSDSAIVSLYWRLVNVAGSEVCFRNSNIRGGNPLFESLFRARMMRNIRLVEMGK